MTTRWLMFLDRGLDATEYADRYERGLEPDRAPYGAEHIQSASVRFSRRTVGDRSLRWAGRLGFDLAHAWRNRKAIRTADVVYCHTEQQYLGAALVLLLATRRHVKLVGQTIWFWEDRSRNGRLRKAIARPLLRRVDLFVYNAWPNFEQGSAAVPKGTHRYIPFGVSTVFRGSDSTVPRERLVVSVGNDRSRDWPTLGEATRDIDAVLRVATGTPPAGIDSSAVQPTSSLADLIGLYARASVVVVPTVENLHASGITSILEAAAVGTPIVATRTGGLDRYFSSDEVVYVAQGDAVALAAAITAALDGGTIETDAQRLRDASASAGYSNDVYWARVSEALVSITQ